MIATVDNCVSSTFILGRFLTFQSYFPHSEGNYLSICHFCCPWKIHFAEILNNYSMFYISMRLSYYLLISLPTLLWNWTLHLHCKLFMNMHILFLFPAYLCTTAVMLLLQIKKCEVWFYIRTCDLSEKCGLISTPEIYQRRVVLYQNLWSIWEVWYYIRKWDLSQKYGIIS